EDPIEAEAHRRGVTYVRLPGGEIGIIGNGAGNTMMTLDLVNRAGGKPANFLDIGGGAKADQVRQALEIVLMDENVKGVLFNIFGGVTPGRGGSAFGGVPVFDSVAEAVEKTGANTSIIFVPPPFAGDAMIEAAAAGLELVVCITEGVPIIDTLRAVRYIGDTKTR